MAGIQPGLWSVKGGNKLLCEKFMDNSNALFLNEKVTKVSKQSSETLFTVLSDKSQRFVLMIYVIFLDFSQNKF